jgi:polysaccharide export outer membrane protein
MWPWLFASDARIETNLGMNPRIICLVGLVALAGGPLLSAESNPIASAPTDSSPSEYLLQPYDLIQVLVFQEPDLERQVRLSQECKITLPLIGTIDLKGKTVREAQTAIFGLYDRDYLVNPQINIAVLDYSKESVSIIGAVNTPGAIPIPPDHRLRLIEAIARAGGFNRLADRKHIKLTREAGSGKMTTVVINADDLMQNGSADTWIMKKGDVVFVQERLL